MSQKNSEQGFFMTSKKEFYALSFTWFFCNILQSVHFFLICLTVRFSSIYKTAKQESCGGALKNMRVYLSIRFKSTETLIFLFFFFLPLSFLWRQKPVCLIFFCKKIFAQRCPPHPTSCQGGSDSFGMTPSEAACERDTQQLIIVFLHF